MTRKITPLLILCAFLVFSLIPNEGISAHESQENSPVHFASVEVNLWPEYDRPYMLVVYTFTLAVDSTIPADMVIRIPTAAGQPTAVLIGPDTSNLFSVNYKRSVEGRWNFIHINTSEPVIRVEYYDPTLVIGKPERRFDYYWAGDYKVDQFLIQIQEPYEASNMQISPTLEKSNWLSDGVLEYFNANLGETPQGKPFSLSLSYQKQTDQLSITGLQVKSVQPINAYTPGRATAFGTFPWLFFLPPILLIIIVAGIWFGFLRVNIKKPVFLQRKAEISAIQKENEQPDLSPLVQCQICGRRASIGDHYCRSCGTRL